MCEWITGACVHGLLVHVCMDYWGCVHGLLVHVCMCLFPQKEVDNKQPVITLDGIRNVKLRSVAGRGIKVCSLSYHTSIKMTTTETSGMAVGRANKIEMIVLHHPHVIITT